MTQDGCLARALLTLLGKLCMIARTSADQTRRPRVPAGGVSAARICPIHTLPRSADGGDSTDTP